MVLRPLGSAYWNKKKEITFTYKEITLAYKEITLAYKEITLAYKGRKGKR
jgi:hypothetical protein